MGELEPVEIRPTLWAPVRSPILGLAKGAIERNEVLWVAARGRAADLGSRRSYRRPGTTQGWKALGQVAAADHG